RGECRIQPAVSAQREDVVNWPFQRTEPGAWRRQHGIAGSPIPVHHQRSGPDGFNGNIWSSIRKNQNLSRHVWRLVVIKLSFLSQHKYSSLSIAAAHSTLLPARWVRLLP